MIRQGLPQGVLKTWRLALLLLFMLMVNCSSTDLGNCPLPEDILPCRCTYRSGDIQIWCSYGGLTNFLEAMKSLRYRTRHTPIDELIVENNNLPSLPGRTFDGLHVVRLMLRDNGLERITSNWLASLENTLLELFIIEPRMRTLPGDALEHMRTLEAVTLQGGVMKRAPKFSGLHKLRYIQLHSPVLTDLLPENVEDLPNLEQLHVIGSPLLNKLDARLFTNLLKLKLLNVSNCGVSWLHPKSMSNLPSLKELVLSNNRISDAGIVGRACRDLQSMQVLHLENNYIDRLVDSSFVDLPSLRELYLSGNLISEVHHGAFRNTPSLKVLDLSKNLIKRVNPAAFVFPSGGALEELWLMDNQLFQVSEMKSLFSSLPRLRFLDMSRNYMEEIPFDVLNGHPTLERLHLDENQIRRIPKKQFAAIPTLRELRLRNNSLSDFAHGPMWNLPSLKGLDLSQNKFRRLDSRLLTYLPSLRSLDLSENYIESVLPDTFIGTLDLETLNLSKNFVNSFHSLTFNHLPRLFEVDVSWNRLREVVPGLPTNIEYLRMSNNQIFNLPSPQSLDLKLPSLRLLDVSSNLIQGLAQDTFSSMNKLQWLYLNDNSLQKIDDGALNGLSKLEYLNIKNNKIRDFTNSYLKGLKSLKEINLDGNFVEVLNSDIARYSSMLETFHLARNRLVEVSKDSFSAARKLQRLDLSHNSLTRLPEAIQGLSMLEQLDVSHNLIQTLQSFSFSNLPSLAELRLGTNQINDLHEDTFKELPKLGFLDMEKNNIGNIARGTFRSLPSLVALRLSHNKLSKLSEEIIVDLPELQSVELQNNLLEEISDRALVNVPHLALLNLSSNYLNGLERSGITGLKSLEVLDVSHNHLSWLESRSLSGMEWLVELKMDHNNICNIYGAPFNSLPRLRVLSLKNNRMTTVVESSFQRLRNSIVVLDIDGNPLSCSCKMIWLQSWLKDTSSEGPRCADGTLFREARLSRTECANSRVVEPVVPGCETDFLPTGVDETTGLGIQQQLSALTDTRNHTRQPSEVPAPNESEYFYDEYVEYQYEEMNGTDGGNKSNPVSYVRVSTVEPASTEQTITTSSAHHISGDTPTLYAGPGGIFPRLNITNPGLGYEDLKKVRPPVQQQQQPQTYNGITFFGIPLPSLSLGNLWKNTIGRSTDGHPGKVEFTGTRGKNSESSPEKTTQISSPDYISNSLKTIDQTTNRIDLTSFTKVDVPVSTSDGGDSSKTIVPSSNYRTVVPPTVSGYTSSPKTVVSSTSPDYKEFLKTILLPKSTSHQPVAALTGLGYTKSIPPNRSLEHRTQVKPSFPHTSPDKRGSVVRTNSKGAPILSPQVETDGFIPMLPGTGGFVPMVGDLPITSTGWGVNASDQQTTTNSLEPVRNKSVNYGKIEQVQIKPNHQHFSDDVEQELRPESQPQKSETTIVNLETFSPPTEMTVDPQDIYKLGLDAVDNRQSQPRYISASLDNTNTIEISSTPDYSELVWGDDIITQYPKKQVVNIKNNMDWYFQNYNKTNLQPYVGSSATSSSTYFWLISTSATLSVLTTFYVI